MEEAKSSANEQEPKRAPEISMRAGRIQLGVWFKKIQHQGREFDACDIKFGRRYRKKDGTWGTATVFDRRDVSHVRLLAGKLEERLELHADGAGKKNETDGQ